MIICLFICLFVYIAHFCDGKQGDFWEQGQTQLSLSILDFSEALGIYSLPFVWRHES